MSCRHKGAVFKGMINGVFYYYCPVCRRILSQEQLDRERLIPDFY